MCVFSDVLSENLFKILYASVMGDERQNLISAKWHKYEMDTFIWTLYIFFLS